MLIINKQTLEQVIKLSDIVKAVEQAFILAEQGGFTLPERTHLGYDKDVLLIMPCLKADVFSTKLVTIYPSNAVQGKPVTMGNLLLSDANTGEALALINGTYLTAMRTGALGAVSAKYLSSEDSHTCGLVGAGMQGLFQVLALATVRPLKEVYVHDTNIAQAERFVSYLTARAPELRCRIVANSEELVKASQIVICATTSTKPVLPDDPQLFNGKHIIGIGSYQPHVREFSNATLTAVLQSSGGVYIDTSHALVETGDLIIPLAQGTLQESQIRLFSKLVVIGGDSGLYKQTTLFKSVGSALFDLCAAQMVYRQVVAAGAGLQVEM